MAEFDSVIHTLGQGTLRVWLGILQRDNVGQEPEAVRARGKAVEEAKREVFTLSGPQCFEAEVMTPGTMCMHMLQEMITSGVYHDDTLMEKHSSLVSGIRGGLPAADHSRQVKQLALAANKLAGDSFSKEVEQQLATHQQREAPAEAQGRMRPRPKP